MISFCHIALSIVCDAPMTTILVTSILMGPGTSRKNFGSASLAGTKESESCGHNSFVFATGACNHALAFVTVHIARFAANEGLINLNLTDQLCSGLVLHRFTNPRQRVMMCRLAKHNGREGGS